MMDLKKNSWLLDPVYQGKKKKKNDEYAVLPPIKDAAIPVEAHVKYVILWIVQKFWIALITNDFSVPAFQSIYCIIWLFELWNAYLAISITDFCWSFIRFSCFSIWESFF